MGGGGNESGSTVGASIGFSHQPNGGPSSQSNRRCATAGATNFPWDFGSGSELPVFNDLDPAERARST